MKKKVSIGVQKVCLLEEKKKKLSEEEREEKPIS